MGDYQILDYLDKSAIEAITPSPANGDKVSKILKQVQDDTDFVKV